MAALSTVHFDCTGCGKCCTGHHVPLTLSETRQWLDAGGQLIVLAEAFLADGPGLPEAQREHAMRRAWPVPCGSSEVWVSITFAAFNPGRCRHLGEDNRCGIYETRPLVCRIYPMEINPHIPLRPETKDCPSEAWHSGPPLIHGEYLVDRRLAELIERSRQADRDDIRAKVAICQALGINVSALKGNGFTAYLPAVAALAQALEQPPLDQPIAPWSLHVVDPALCAELEACAVQVCSEQGAHYSFIGF
ncbi:YkgJ family cysteine cluster protein [Pseudomonas rubra]|uniref:YkgJ family cysteine cluster protein n=1 Tax=Pseudomonas rubra TaxID=2942627 RepID=A0ABT5P9L2_9PSED|nr:YkgJ family cysteine cluster protein [Pseudomonas rubra]MDD1014986.1 YkgJ family cysteine cluster protein [Pseudomonas rubra]MDD1038107.1 YkgJ family cysteine cluster protein [Pseudomonas rubra]MDD1156620.1 YkgJ family cysteine cluster protein [Pseudomonas rubra]